MKRKEIKKIITETIKSLDVILDIEKTEVESKDFYRGGKLYLERYLNLLEK